MKKQYLRNSWRYVLQFGMIALLIVVLLYAHIDGNTVNIEAYCPFGGLQALTTYLNSKTLACNMSMNQIMMGVSLAIMVMLFSKLFCGYLCPLGMICEQLGKLGRKCKLVVKISNRGVSDCLLRSIKYILLVVTFYMTLTSSELFCKNFDPYYALATGFRGEITAWMSILSLVMLLVGSVVVKMFWCKYICPLGALSHLFKFAVTFILLLLLKLFLSYIGYSISWFILLFIAAIISYLYEIILGESRLLPLVKVTRDSEICNGCGACTVHCPMQIEVAKMSKVTQIDCTLCGECIAGCRSQALHFNHRPSFRWLPALLVLFFLVAGMIAGSTWDLPTINERWDTSLRQDQLATLELEGLRTVKCYGSAKAFSAKLQNIEGVCGVAVYVRRFAVRIYYDPTIISEQRLREQLFIPTKLRLHPLPNEVNRLQVIRLRVDQLFDKEDMANLADLFRNVSGFYGIESQYDCPVLVTLYVDGDTPMDREQIEQIVQSDHFERIKADGSTQRIDCNYNVSSIESHIDTITRLAYAHQMFRQQRGSFDHNIKHYGDHCARAIYQLPFKDADHPYILRQMPFFESFLSNCPEILGYETAMLDEEHTVLRIFYVKDALTDEQLWEFLQTPVWTIHYADNTIREEQPRFKFEHPGVTLSE